MKHILVYSTNIPLCKNINSVSSSLYGEACGECFELAQKLLRGQIKLSDINNPNEISTK